MFGLVFFDSYFMVDAPEAKVETEGFAGNSYALLKFTASSYVMLLNFRGFLPFRPILTIISRLRIVNVLAPMLVKLLLMEDFKASMDVSVPTSEVIPMVIIKTVRIVRKSWLRIAPSDILIFSPKAEAIILYK